MSGPWGACVSKHFSDSKAWQRNGMTKLWATQAQDSSEPAL